MMLIDKDAILHDLENGVYPASMTYTLAVDIAKGLIEVATEIDAVPVVRGEWIVDECDTSDEVPSYSWIDFHCSECSTDYGLEEGQYGWYRCDKIPYNYCPNCGAKMEDKP